MPISILQQDKEEQELVNAIPLLLSWYEVQERLTYDKIEVFTTGSYCGSGK